MRVIHVYVHGFDDHNKKSISVVYLHMDFYHISYEEARKKTCMRHTCLVYKLFQRKICLTYGCASLTAATYMYDRLKEQLIK